MYQQPVPLTAGEQSISAVFDLDALLTSAQRTWRDKARAVARQQIAPIVDADAESQTVRTELFTQLGAAGMFGMHISGYGCAGVDPVSYGLACMEIEAVDSSWRTIVSVQGSLAMSAIAKFGDDAQRERWLPEMAAGRSIGAFALTEPHSGSDPAGMRTHARRDGDDWVLSGSKRWIGLASLADVLVVFARTADGFGGFLVPSDSPGVTVEPITGKLAMRASVQCDINFDDVRVPQAARLPGVMSLAGPFSCLTEARFGIAWGVMGAARESLAVALERAQNRSGFGRPLADMQLVQSKLAESLIAYQRGVLLALHLASLKERGTLTPAQVSIAKLDNVRQAIDVAHLSRQILGGDGITSEFPVMRHLANLEAVRTYEGTDEVHTLVIGRALTGRGAF